MSTTRIQSLRKRRGWTQEKLAEESGIGLRTVQRVESGADANPETLALIAAALGVPADELFDGGAERADVQDQREAIEAINARLKAEQELQWKHRRDITSKWKYWYPAIGVLLSALFIGLIGSGANGAWAMMPIAWWAVGYFVMDYLRAPWLEPRLDKRFPLTTRSEVGR